MSAEDMTQAIDVLEKKTLEEVQGACNIDTLTNLGQALRAVKDATKETTSDYERWDILPWRMPTYSVEPWYFVPQGTYGGKFA